jgi:hypothetical protein
LRRRLSFWAGLLGSTVAELVVLNAKAAEQTAKAAKNILRKKLDVLLRLWLFLLRLLR